MQHETIAKQKRIATACDACKRRKVRCNGANRCQQCEHLNLRCSYTPNVKRGGSRKNVAGRGTVIAEYRKQTSSNGTWSGQIRLSPAKDDSSQVTIPPTVPTLSHPDPEYFLHLLPDYLAAVYPVNPVITELEIRSCISSMTTDREAASFVYAFAAVTVNLTKTDFLHNAPDLRSQISNLVTRSLEHRDTMGLESNTQPSFLRIMTSIFIQICYMGLRRIGLGFYYLRDAITMVQMLRISSAESLSSLPLSERSRRQRVYWECFIHERFTALTDYHPLVLDPLPSLPEPDTSLPASIAQGWNLIIQTFLPVDKEFVSYWIGDRSQITLEWVERKHRQLDLDDADWQLAISVLSDMQQADLIITRQWLRTLVWQMALSNVRLSSHALTLPLRLSSQLRGFLEGLSHSAVGIHGSSILYKLFEITDTMADVVIHLPDASRDATLARVDDILFLKDFIFGFERIEDVHRRVLIEKFLRMKEKYPEMEEIRQLVGTPSALLEGPSEGMVLWGDEWNAGLREHEMELWQRSRAQSWVGFVQAP